MSHLGKKHHAGAGNSAHSVLFFPKDKQNVGTVWHCHQCQDLALVRLGCRHSLTRRSNHHSHSGSNGQECGMGKAGVAAAPAFPKALCTRRLAGRGSTVQLLPASGSGARAHTYNPKASQTLPNI